MEQWQKKKKKKQKIKQKKKKKLKIKKKKEYQNCYDNNVSNLRCSRIGLKVDGCEINKSMQKGI